jgi:uncharacterized protein (TIRG00374 family)
VDPPKSRSIGSLVLKGLLAIVVSGATLWWAFSGVDLAYVRAHLARVSASSIAVYILGALFIHAVRTVRYAMLVRPLGKVSWRAVTAANSVGLPAAVFLPLRLGELVRPLMIARSGIPLPGALASVVVERVIDGLFNVGLFFTLLALLPGSALISTELKSVALIMLAGFGGGLVFLLAAYFARERVLGLAERVLQRISPNLAKKAVLLIGTFLDGLASIGGWSKIVLFLLLTATYWGVNGLCTWALTVGYGVDVPVIAGPFAVSCVVFAITVPAGPAFAGTMEAGYRVGMAPFGVTPSDAALVAIVSHVLTLCLLALYAAIGFQLAEARMKEGPV